MKMGHGMWRAMLFLSVFCVRLAGVGVASGNISITMVPVGNPGNAADPYNPNSVPGGFGAVGYAYSIGQTDVTAAQYTAFLNAVAQTDTYGLYSSGMATASFASCGISQSGGSGSYVYATTKNASFPVNYVTWGDAARFCNWLSNGQPTGAEGNGTTETGSYTMNGQTSNAALVAITRNANAGYAIPTENEWYKAAYYNPASSSYYLYTTQSNSQPSNALSATGTNNANYLNPSYTDPTNYLTPVGAFADSISAYGTFDQGGDVFEWDESVYYESGLGGLARGLRGGSFINQGVSLQSGNVVGDLPTVDVPFDGFRVVQVPEPAPMGILGLAVVGTLVRRRSDASR